jgi:hypothetical protein
MARRRDEEQPARLPVRFATLGEIRIYWVYEHELDTLAHGTANALFLNFALFLLPISITLLVTLLTTTIPSDRLFYGFLTVALTTAIAGILLLSLWWRSYKSAGDLLRTIQARMPPARQSSAEPESSGETGPP